MDFAALLLGGLGALIGAAIQYRFQRLSADREERREVIETHLLQLQDALESLYYRINNIRDWGGHQVMTDEYFRLTSVYAIGRVLAHASLLVSEGIYAKLHYDEVLKRTLKSGLHRIQQALDDERFLHYHRLQLAENLASAEGVSSYTRFLSDANKEQVAPAVAAAAAFIESASATRLDDIRAAAGELVRLLEERTRVPSALSLMDRRPASS